MKTQILISFGTLLLITAAATTYLMVRKHDEHNNKLLLSSHQVPIYPTRDDLSTCTIQKCFHALWECQVDHECIEEATFLNQQYMSHPKKFKHIFGDIKNSILYEYVECQKTCGVFDYLSRCAKEDVYIKNCFMEETGKCQTKNQDYFDNFNTCRTRQYKTCDNLSDKEDFAQCFAQELIWCASDGLTKFKGHFDRAMYCV